VLGLGIEPLGIRSLVGAHGIGRVREHTRALQSEEHLQRHEQRHNEDRKQPIQLIGAEWPSLTPPVVLERRARGGRHLS